jgi:hypothetical protein
MKLGNLFALVAITATLAACGGGGGGGDAPAPAQAPAPAGAETYSFSSTTTPAVTFSSTAPGVATVAANEKFRISNSAGSLGNSSTSNVSGTCGINITSTSPVYEIAFTAAPCVKKITFTKGASVAEITVTANAAAGTTVAASGATDKYVGSWGVCAPVTNATNGVLSALTIFAFTKTGANTMNLSVDGKGFQAANCAGVAFNSFTGLGTALVTVNGTKLIGTQTVDRLDLAAVSRDIPEFNGSLKDIALVSGNVLFLGASSLADTNGYPTALDNVKGWTKQ